MPISRRRLALAAFGASALPAAPAAAPYRVVLELNSDGQEFWQGVLNNVENLRASLGGIEIEVVAHGKGLGLLRRESGEAERMRKAAANGVVFAACRNTMRRLNLTVRDLLDFARPVDSGVAEVVRKQAAGWAYLKAGG